MVDTSDLTNIGGQIADKIMSGAVWVLAIFIIGGALAIVMYYFLIYKRKFDINVTIRSQRAGGKTERIQDMAAILTDRKTKQRYFKLWNFKTEMPVPRFEVLESSKGKDYLDIYQKGDEEFYFLKPPKIDKRYIQKTDGTWIPWAEQQHQVMDAEVAYWNVKKKKEDWFAKDKLIWKVLEFAPQIITTVTLIFILWIFLDKLPGVLSSLQQLSKEINQAGRAEVIESLTPLLFLRWK